MKKTEQIILNYFSNYLFFSKRSILKELVRDIIKKHVVVEIAQKILQNNITFSFPAISTHNVLGEILKTLANKEEKKISFLIKKVGSKE